MSVLAPSALPLAPAQGGTEPRRHDFMVWLANLTEVERVYIDTAVAIFADPALARARADLLAGRLALRIDGDEVAWMELPGKGGAK